MATRKWNDPEYRSAYHRKYREDHRDELAEKRIIYCQNKQALKEIQRRHYVKNRDVRLAQSKEYTKSHPDLRREINRRYAKKHKIKIADKQRNLSPEMLAKRRARNKDWMKRNKEKGRLAVKRYAVAHPDKVAAAYRRWADNNPEAVAVNHGKRTARMRGAEGSHTPSDIRSIWERQKHKCAVPDCPHPISANGKTKYHVDHITALKNQGSNWPDNLQILCRHHNATKHAKDEYQWAQAHGRLFI